MARVINLMRVLRDSNAVKLTSEGEHIISFIQEPQDLGRGVTVSDLVRAQLFGAAPTVQRKVDELARSGMLVYHKDKNDQRRVVLVLSDVAFQYLEKLEQGVSSIMCSGRKT